MILAADFETTTDENDCRVWAWGVCEVGRPTNFTYGNNIDGFMKHAKDVSNSTFYFHNLKFDGEFIFIWLFENGFTHVTDRRDLDSKTFSTLISNQGQFYSIKIMFEKKGKRTKSMTIYDSLKILPFSVDSIAKGFNLPISKLEIDYHEIRKVGHELTDLEVDYLRNDVTIVAAALEVLFDQGLDKMTQGSNALHDFKQTITPRRFEKWFPVPDYDSDVRQSYKGGFTYLNPKYKGVDVGPGVVFDVNSLYPSVMYEMPMPYGEGIFFKGKYEEDSLFNLHVQMISCQFQLKKDRIPTIQLKNNLLFSPTQYLTSSDDEEIVMCLTNIDLELFLDQYDVYNLEYISGWKFKSSTVIFKDYIDKWSNEKIQAKLDGNKAMYLLSKLMLNALYGKFALNPNVQSKIPYYENGMIKYFDGEKETRDPLYIPVGTFVTSYARDKTIRAAQSVYERFIYADTDSLHLIGTEIPDCLDIHDTDLGRWSHESTFVRGRFLRAKSYFETIIISDKHYDKMNDVDKAKCYYMDDIRVKDQITCAGLPEMCHKHVTWDNFKIGTVYPGKLQAKHVVGGIVLEERTFKILE